MFDSIVEHYRGLPSSVLLAQAFLAAGWLRASTAHGMRTGWWNGTEITDFRLENSAASIEWYRRTMLDGPVTEWPVAIGVVVVVMQVLVALMLVLNIRPLLGLALGAALNVNFVLAGAVNPSVFYLVIGAALALWHLEAVNRSNLRRLSGISMIGGALLLGSSPAANQNPGSGAGY